MEGDAIVGIVEGGNDDEFVGDVEVRVAGGKALSIEINGRGHGKSFDAKRLAVLVGHELQALEIVLEWGVIGVIRIFFDDGDDGGGIDKASEIVDVAVGVVSGNAIA
jgi:hypothetical protein